MCMCVCASVCLCQSECMSIVSAFAFVSACVHDARAYVFAGYNKVHKNED